MIATDEDGLREVVKNGVNGLLVPYNDTESLSHKIIWLLEDETKQVGFGRKGREKVEAVYDWDRVAKEVLGIYHQLLATAKVR
ncbi:glycosyltransferase family 4 protein [bacterium]|nr:glycosyltransferase family 4 protein [bacterium]